MRDFIYKTQRSPESVLKSSRMMKMKCTCPFISHVISFSVVTRVEAARRMVENYDFVVTSGGIGPTHDDITYASLAKAFQQPLKHHEETLKRLAAYSSRRSDIKNQTPEQKTARERMALFPADAEVLFVGEDIWVPVCRLEGKLCIFPGIPGLFQTMLAGLTPYLPLPDSRPFRHLIGTRWERPYFCSYFTCFISFRLPSVYPNLLSHLIWLLCKKGLKWTRFVLVHTLRYVSV